MLALFVFLPCLSVFYRCIYVHVWGGVGLEVWGSGLGASYIHVYIYSIYSSFVHMHVYTYAYIYMNHVYAQGLEFRAQGRMYICMYICMYHIHVSYTCTFTCTYIQILYMHTREGLGFGALCIC